MQRVSSQIYIAIAVVACLLVLAAGCTNEQSTGLYRSALTDEACEPDPGSFMPSEPSGSGHMSNGRGGHNSPTGIPGDNIDDPHSGKIDCYYDGNSGQGDDRRHPCTPEDFPQPGCDATGCCDEDVLPEDPGEFGPPEEPAPGDPGTEEPAPEEPAPGDPAPEEPAPEEPAPEEPAPEEPLPDEPLI